MKRRRRRDHGLVGPRELLRPNRTKPLQNFLSLSSSASPLRPTDLAREEKAQRASTWPEQPPPPWRPGSRPGRPLRGGPWPGAALGRRWCGPRYPSRRARRRTPCRSPRRSSTPPRYRSSPIPPLCRVLNAVRKSSLSFGNWPIEL